jgi:RNA polymerase sigma factor (sigma-70 family)
VEDSVGAKQADSTVFPASEIERSDADLWERCKRGDQDAWDALVARFQRLVFAIPRRAGLGEERAADIFQEVFLTLFQKLDEIEQPERLRAWIVTTAKFKTWAAVRGEKGHFSPATEEEMELEMQSLRDTAPLADEMLIELEQQHLIRAAVARLEDRCRTIISMLYLRQTPASYADVGKAIGTGETSISPLRSRCLKKLEKLLNR